jgi:PBP1b-binding outer membrane lipoprotein LpoB
MSKTAIVPTLAAAAIVLAGCGGEGHPAAPSPAKPAANAAQAHVTGQTYAARLASNNETPRTTIRATAIATITIAPRRDDLCWRITKITGVPTPSNAYIQRGRASTTGSIVIALNPSYRTAGCVSAIAPVLLSKIEAHPDGYYMEIYSPQHPLGAVRGQL